MLGKRIPSRTFFTILIGVILLTAAVLSSMAGASESTTAFTSKKTVGQRSGGAEVHGIRGTGQETKFSSAALPSSALQREEAKEGDIERVGVGENGASSAPSASSTDAQTRTVTPSTTLRINYTYDDAGRLVGVDYGDGTSITYTYDNAGNLLRREVTVPCDAVEDVGIAGPPTTTVGIAATFTATVSPITATTPVTYTWQATEQPPQIHTGGGISDTAVFTWSVSGPQVVTVTAANECSAVSDTHPITITNRAPVAHAGPDQTVTVSDTGSLDASGSYDPDGHTPLTYGWTQTGGPPVTLSDATVVSPTFTAPATPTVLTFTLTVTDAFGLASTPDSVAVTVRGAMHYVYLPVVLRNQ